MDPQLTKAAIRREAKARRRAQPDKDEVSRRIIDQVLALPQFAAARTILIYLHAPHEVRTQQAAIEMLAAGKRLAIPVTSSDSPWLFELTSLDELQLGRHGILEPPPELTAASPRAVAAEQIDLVIAPGVAFDRHGTRLGHGYGHYDRLLAQLRPGTPKIGLAFACQMFDHIPRELHDIPMDIVIVE